MAGDGLEFGVRGGNLATRRTEGRFWKRGRVHKVAIIRLSDRADGVHCVAYARTGCGESVEWPALSAGWDPGEPDACKRKGCQ